jgi:hypothetical protein
VRTCSGVLLLVGVAGEFPGKGRGGGLKRIGGSCALQEWQQPTAAADCENRPSQAITRTYIPEKSENVPKHSTGQGGAKSETEITLQMIEAGIAVLRVWIDDTLSCLFEQLASEVFEAMQLASLEKATAAS